jgi:hypothetical protein
MKENNMALIEDIRSNISTIAQQENILESKAFIYWILEQYYGLKQEDIESKIISTITEGGNDKRIDAFIENEDHIHIVQCKYFDDENKEVGEKDIVLFKGCIDWLRQPEEVKKLNRPRLYDSAVTYVDNWDEGASVELHYFAFGKFNVAANSERRVFNKSDQRSRIQMIFHNINDILNLYQANIQSQNPLADESITFDVQPGQYFLRETGNFPSIVMSIKGKSLADIHQKYGDRLFESNIRLFRGIRKGSINAGILDTIASNDRNKFWYYNNGISFVCRGFTTNDASNPTQVTIKGPQIINGCQTTVCLSESETPHLDDVEILARFIKAPLDDVELITLYTNSQNPVSEAQLKSNDPTQGRLKNDFDVYTKPYFYSIKEGDWKRLTKEQKQKYDGRIIDLISITQAIYAFRNDPAFARRYRNELFSKKYNDIFKKDIHLEELLLPWRILVDINVLISNFRRQELNRLNADPNKFDDKKAKEIRRKEFLLYSNLIMLHFIHNLIVKKYGEYNHDIAKKLLNNQLEDRTRRLSNYIIAILSFSEKLENETNLPRYLKSFDNIQSLYNEIEKEIEKDKARGSDPLDTLPLLK